MYFNFYIWLMPILSWWGSRTWLRNVEYNSTYYIRKNSFFLPFIPSQSKINLAREEPIKYQICQKTGHTAATCFQYIQQLTNKSLQGNQSRYNLNRQNNQYEGNRHGQGTQRRPSQWYQIQSSNQQGSRNDYRGINSFPTHPNFSQGNRFNQNPNFNRNNQNMYRNPTQNNQSRNFNQNSNFNRNFIQGQNFNQGQNFSRRSNFN